MTVPGDHLADLDKTNRRNRHPSVAATRRCTIGVANRPAIPETIRCDGVYAVAVSFSVAGVKSSVAVPDAGDVPSLGYAPVMGKSWLRLNSGHERSDDTPQHEQFDCPSHGTSILSWYSWIFLWTDVIDSPMIRVMLEDSPAGRTPT